MKKDFGILKNGERVDLYILKNHNGMEAAVSNYGATWVSALVPDKNGVKRDMLLGYDDAAGYEAGEEAIGAIVGRVANRIAGAEFTLNGRTYRLCKNKGENSLHSGPDVYQKRVWNTVEEDDSHVVFELKSPDGDQGYPGAMKIQVTYSLDEENELRIAYRAETSEDTIFNMTNHAYFNLNGQGVGDILNHEVWVDADTFTVADADSIPTGEIALVEGTPMDFRQKKPVGRDIDENYEALIYGNGYDHNWVINGEGYRKAAEITGDKSGITMEVYTDRPGVQIYAGNFLSDEKGKGGVLYQKRTGICFETQNFPDAIHHENFPSPVIKRGDVLETVTAYKFIVK
ncbi:MAG: aldose epimerase family protein [Eubacteriales bacterium]|nr:aldose epimerase family protein [Eubacteriales bacterium]